MKIQFTKADLKRAIDNAKWFVPTRSSNPALCVLEFTGGPAGVYFRGGSSDHTTQAFIPGNYEPFRVGIGNPELTIAKIIGSVPNDSQLVTLEVVPDSSELGIEFGEYNTKLQLVANMAEPSLTIHDKTPMVTMSGADLLGIKNTVMYAANERHPSPVFGGVRIEALAGKSLAFVTSDGFRIAKTNVLKDFEVLSTLECLVPKAALETALKGVLATDVVRLSIDNGLLFISTDRYAASLQLLEGVYPDYTRVIPKAYLDVFKVDRALFIEAVDRATILVDKSANSRIDVGLKATGFVIEASGSYGASKEFLPVEYEGDPNSVQLSNIVYNARYLREALVGLPFDEVVFKLSGTTQPSILASATEDSHFALIMPLRT
jgi:DNA polymerase III subunit beta